MEKDDRMNTFDFDAEFAKGLTPEEFKDEMSKRIKAYPWKNKPQEYSKNKKSS